MPNYLSDQHHRTANLTHVINKTAVKLADQTVDLKNLTARVHLLANRVTDLTAQLAKHQHDDIVNLTKRLAAYET